jgi:hypothetical protein
VTFGEGASVVVMGERKRLGESWGNQVALIGCGTKQATKCRQFPEMQRLRLDDGMDGGAAGT